MATLFKHEPTGLYRCQFTNPVTGKRATVYTGMSKLSDAGSFLKGLEHLLACLKEDGQPDRAAQKWIADLSAGMRAKLSADKIALISTDTAAPKTFAALLDLYIDRRKGSVDEKTLRKWRSQRVRLIEHFGERKALASLNEADGEDFRAWMQSLRKERKASTAKDENGDPRPPLPPEPMKESHIRKTCQFANQVCDYAVKRGWIEASPFESVPKSSPKTEQHEYLSRPDTQKLIDAAPHDEFRLLIGLCRYGGMRNPSETQLLRWRDFDFKRKRFHVTSPKGKRHGKGTRETPLFQELVPLIEKAGQGKQPDEWVIDQYRGSNNRTLLEKVATRAGIDFWESPFIALRASCETDLVAKYPIHDVCKWLGNSPAIAMRHYLIATEANFERAANEPFDTAESNATAPSAQAKATPERSAT